MLRVLLASANVLFSSSQDVVASRTPVVLIPGLTGSGLEVRETKARLPHFNCRSDTGGGWMKTWLDLTQLAPEIKDCLIARLTLTYDEVTDTYSNLPGVEIRPLGWKDGAEENKTGIDSLYKYEFGEMFKQLQEQLGYKLGIDMLLAPYDWRLAGDAHAKKKNGVGGFYEDLKALIEESVKSSGRKAVIVSHSLGCPTTLYFFNRYISPSWQKKFIHRWVALSGPWMGSTPQAVAYLGGWTFGAPKWLVPHDYVRPVQVNCTSGVWLSPHPTLFGNHTIVATPSQNYSAADLPSIISLIGQQAGGSQTAALFEKPTSDLSRIQFAPEHVQVHNWYSNGIPTAETLVYNKDITANFNEAPETTIFGDGDGVVNLVSLQQAEKNWPKSNLPVESRLFPNTTHFGMLSDSRVLAALTELLESSYAEFAEDSIVI